jgi:NTE family protein
VPEQPTDRTKPALALSGGGFRATLFHIGSLMRLNELKLLQGIERFSSVSGGSITAGVLARSWGKLAFENGRATAFDKLVTEPLRAFCEQNVDMLAIAKGSLLPGKRISDVLVDIYDKSLFKGLTLDQLDDKPQFLFNSTNMQTGRLFRFSKRRIADYRLGEISNPQGVRLALAVAASSAFPPFLSPVEIQFDPALWVRLDGADLFDTISYRSKLYLTDGGAYDNLGLETIDSFKTIMVSDAGAPFALDPDTGTWWHQQAMRALDIATDQARGLRKRLLVAESTANQRAYAFWSIDGDIAAYGVADCLPCNKAKTVALSKTRTRLEPFSEQEQGELINWGYALADAALRRYVIPGQAAPAPQWPVAEYRLDA